jgi:hypothetical protein
LKKTPAGENSLPEKIEGKKVENLEGILRELAVKLFEEYKPVHVDYLPVLERSYFNGTPPDVVTDKLFRFADWMMESFPAKVSSMKDFFFHWNNESCNENGFRLQFDAHYRAAKKKQEQEAAPDRLAWPEDKPKPCLAPGCFRLAVDTKDDIPLCALCARAYPNYEDYIEVMSGHNDCEVGESYGTGDEEIMVIEVPEEEL